MRAISAPRLDVYQVLRADPRQSWQELRRSYRARARELHPDVQVHRQGHERLDAARATALFAELQAAWAMVATPQLREAYDRSQASVGIRLEVAPRPPRAPAWRAGPRSAVLLRSGPGDLHIAVPGGDWDLSLAQFAARVASGALAALLIGDLPPHAEMRQALRGIQFAERHRLITMVGLEEPAEEREPELGRGDDDGTWKLAQLARAMSLWAAAMPGRRRELPYCDDLLLMGRLSLAGYELNLPHPAGLFAAAEPRPRSRPEALQRRSEVRLQLRIPAPTLLLAAAWSQDQELIEALGRGWPDRGDTRTEAVRLQRGLAGRRARTDHHEALWGSVLDDPASIPEALDPLARFGSAWEWLQQPRRCPPSLPWGEPAARCGRDCRLSDAAARLVARLADTLMAEIPDPARLVAIKGPSLWLAAPPTPAKELAGPVEAALSGRLRDLLGFPVPVTVG